IVNLKTAKALRLAVRPTLLARRRAVARIVRTPSLSSRCRMQPPTISTGLFGPSAESPSCRAYKPVISAAMIVVPEPRREMSSARAPVCGRDFGGGCRSCGVIVRDEDVATPAAGAVHLDQRHRRVDGVLGDRAGA